MTTYSIKLHDAPVDRETHHATATFSSFAIARAAARAVAFETDGYPIVDVFGESDFPVAIFYGGEYLQDAKAHFYGGEYLQDAKAHFYGGEYLQDAKAQS